MIKKALIPLLLVVAIAVLALKFFSTTDSLTETLDPFLVLPSNTIVASISTNSDDNFLDFPVSSVTQFISSSFPDEISTCTILVDSLILDSTDFSKSLSLNHVYSKKNIYKLNQDLFFIDGRKVYASKNAVLIQQLILKIQNKDFLTLTTKWQELKALTNESKTILCDFQETENFILEFNEINETAKAYSYQLKNETGINSTALNFIPRNAENVTLNNQTIHFDWANLTFSLEEDLNTDNCNLRYRDAKICKTDSISFALINGIKISCSNSEAINELIDAFYDNRCYRNANAADSKISFLKSTSSLSAAVKLLYPNIMNKGILVSYSSSKSLKVYHVLSADNEYANDLITKTGEYSVNLPEAIIYGPYAVANHRSKSECIILQTSDHTLYYLNSKGKILWKASMDGEILGEPIEIDRYRNRKVQYILNTKNKLYQLDVLGRNVEGFPKKIESTGPATLVVYKPKKERLLLPSKNTIYNFQLDGSKTKGWNTPKLKGSAKSIEYKKQKTLDCILVQTDKEVVILNPKGDIRNKGCNDDYEVAFSKMNSTGVAANIFTKNKDGNLFVSSTKACNSQKFSGDVFQNLVDLGNYVYAVGDEQLVLFTSDADLVENRFLNEKPWALNNGVIFNDGNSYTLFIQPGIRFTLKEPIKALRAISVSDKICYSENKSLYFVDHL